MAALACRPSTRRPSTSGPDHRRAGAGDLAQPTPDDGDHQQSTSERHGTGGPERDAGAAPGDAGGGPAPVPELGDGRGRAVRRGGSQAAASWRRPPGRATVGRAAATAAASRGAPPRPRRRLRPAHGVGVEQLVDAGGSSSGSRAAGATRRRRGARPGPATAAPAPAARRSAGAAECALDDAGGRRRSGLDRGSASTSGSGSHARGVVRLGARRARRATARAQVRAARPVDAPAVGVT